MGVTTFFSTYFSLNQWNFVNTLGYALLTLFVLYLLYKGLDRIEVNFDFKFFLALLPFVLLGSGLRALVDHGYVFKSFWTVTPGIYFIISGSFLFTYLICFFLGKRYNFEEWKVCASIGFVLFLLVFILSGAAFKDSWAFFLVLGLAAFTSTIILFTLKLVDQEELTRKLNFLPVFGHMVDASATFIAVDFFGAVEKHPLTSMFNKLVGTGAGLFILKLIVIIPAVYLISTEIEDKNLRNFLFIALATLGLAEGLRNAITIILV